MMSVNQASSYHLQQQQNQQNLQSKSTRPLQTTSPSSSYQHQQHPQQQQPGHPIITYGVQQQSYQPYNTWSGGYNAGLDPSYQSHQYQRMWPLVRRIFPAEENLIKTIFAIHLTFLAFFVLNRDVQLNNAFLLYYNAVFIHLLFVLFSLCLFWALLSPTDYNPMDLAQLVALVSVGVDAFVLFKLFSRYSTEENVERYVYWLLLMVVRLLTVILLRKMWADRVAAALDVYGLYSGSNAQSSAYQLTPAVSATQKMQMQSSPSPLSSQRQPVNFTVGGGSVRGDNYGNQASREAYLYEASLNA